MRVLAALGDRAVAKAVWHCSVRAARADHIHLVAMLARQDGTRPRLWNDYYQVGEACRAAEQRFGLRQTAPRDRTAARRPTRAESEKARRHGFQEAPRVALRRAVSTAAAGAASEQEFFARLDRAGVLVRKRFSTRNPGEVTGYAVALTGDTRPGGWPGVVRRREARSGPDPAQAPLPLGPRPHPGRRETH